MKVAALYDVHGMPWPLEAVLREAGDERVDLVLFGGDLIEGPYPRRTLELARGVEARFVRGNCEREPSDWDRAHLTREQLRWLADLPLTQSLDGVLYCHAAPEDDLPLTTAVTPDETVAARFAGIDEPTVVIGHTHHQFDRRVGGLRVVSAGSVGMPYEGEVAAFWALVEDGEPVLRRTPFDVERAIAETAASDWPPAAAFVAENLRVAVSREEAIAQLERG
ncbi:MAG TPA: metallophosphoesterase family protein [Gaiellaceae bacterium]|nr:metallophosphoesterase family protein [Gaiellaceae bacterium]